MRTKKRNKLLILISTLIFMLLLVGTAAEAVGVRPLVIDLELKPGETRDFQLILTPGLNEETVDLTLYQPVQLLTGGLTYKQPDHVVFSAISWINLAEHQVKVYPDEETKVTGTVSVPFSAGGSYTVVIMVEPRIPPQQQGVSVQVRYAVRLNIRVERPGLRQTAQLEHFVIEANEQGAPIVSALVNNNSVWDYIVSGEITLRDEERRLVERITLKSQAAIAAGNKDTRVYPGAQVEFLGEVTRPLNPGEYSIQAFLRYGDSGQILHRDTLVVNLGDFVFPGFDEMSPLLINPLTVEYQLRSGERKSQIFEFENLMGEPIGIEFDLAEMMPDYSYSMTEWVELRSATEFTMPARAKTRMGLTIAIPRDTPDGSYHGKIRFKVRPESADQQDEISVPLSIVVGANHQQDIQIRSITATNIEDEGTYFSLDVLNSGNVAFLPLATAIITDEQGEYVDRLTFQLSAESKLLPLETRQGEALIPQLEPGIYFAEVEITSGSVVLKKKTTQVTIK